MNKTLAELVEQKMRDIAQFREIYIEAWLAETGLMPTECMIVQDYRDGQVFVSVVKKDEKQLKLEEKVKAGEVGEL